MRTIATLQDPDAGSITLDGIDVLTQKDEVRRVLGYLPQEFGVYPKMSAVDMLSHLAILKGIVVAASARRWWMHSCSRRISGTCAKSRCRRTRAA